MKRLILAAVVVLGLSEFAPARAQFLVGPGYPYGYSSGYSYSYRSGFGFSFGGPHFRVKGFAGGFVTRSFIAPPPVVFVPAGFTPVSPFWGGWGPGFGAFSPFGPFGPFGPPAVAVPVPVPVPVVVAGGAVPDPNAVGVAGIAPARNEPALLPQGDFLVISPKKEETIPPVTKVAKLPKPPGPKLVFDPFKVPAKVKAEVVEADPKKEAARLVKLGRASFAAGDFGRAAEHFERATTADPADATTYFLHAQAKFAAGQYAEAVARIREGLALDKNWPAAAFDPAALYGDKPERFVLHLLALKKALNDNPKEGVLEFLLGYELWFSGDKVEADKLFRAAEKNLPAPDFIALFK